MSDRRNLAITLTLYLALAAVGGGFLWWRIHANNPDRLLQEQVLEKWPTFGNPPTRITQAADMPPPPRVPVRTLNLPAPKGVKIHALADPIRLEAANFTAQIYLDSPIPEEAQDLVSREYWLGIESFQVLPIAEVDQLAPEAKRDYLIGFSQRSEMVRDAQFLIYEAGTADVVLLREPRGDIMGWFWPKQGSDKGIWFSGTSPTEEGAHELIRLLGQAESIR